VSRDQIRRARVRVRAREADVVDPFHDDHVRDAGLHQHITVESRERAGTGAVAEQLVATNPGIQHTDRGSLARGKPSRQVVGPAAVHVCR